MERKFAGITLVSIGAVLILSALLLFLYISLSDYEKSKENRDVYVTLVKIAEKQQAKPEVTLSEKEIESSNIEDQSVSIETENLPIYDIINVEYTPMTVVRIGEFDYVGFIDIPSLALSLPVLADSNERNLKASPCRQFGSPESDDFVIAGHNYRRHFANLYQVKINDVVHFTDMDGDITNYVVAAVRVVDQTDVEAVLNTDYDLILYTCDYTGKNRTIVCCKRT